MNYYKNYNVIFDLASMPRPFFTPTDCHQGCPNLGDFLTARPAGLLEPECWAVLCQAVQALQDLFLSDGASGGCCMPLVAPNTVVLSSRGKVRFLQSSGAGVSGTLAHLNGYLAPEYRPKKQASDTEAEKMWIYGLGETLKRVTLTSHAATSRISGELCQVLTDMTRPQPAFRASLMNLLDVISDYCKNRQQLRPFSHIVMDLHQEAMAALEIALDTPWGPPAMPELRSLTKSSIDLTYGNSIPRRWANVRSPTRQKLTREASTSMENLMYSSKNSKTPRPKSLCISEGLPFDFQEQPQMALTNKEACNINSSVRRRRRKSEFGKSKGCRNPVQRAASRLYKTCEDVPRVSNESVRECVGPEFVVRAALPNKQLVMPHIKGNTRKTVTVILLNGLKVDVICNPNTTTAGELFELVIQGEHIEDNFMLGLSALIAGDFVFIPSDTRVCKALVNNSAAASTLFVRIRFFLPSLRGIRAGDARHLLYLQLRRSILEHQLPCSFKQLIELNGLALQAEFGDYIEKEHGDVDYFLLEHYVPETMSCAAENTNTLKTELIEAHKSKKGLEFDKIEEEFIVAAQKLPHYGGHFYTAIWVLKDNTHKDVWLYISAQGINLYERSSKISQFGPMPYETFEWKSIQTLCYSKQYLCILPHSIKMHHAKLKKYKLKMDNKKSYFTFRLASLHHQFFLRLRTEYASLNSLSQQYGIPLKDMKNETNSLYKLEALTNQLSSDPYPPAAKPETEFKIDFRASSNSSNEIQVSNKWMRSKSIGDCTLDQHIEVFQNKENEKPQKYLEHKGLVLDSSCLSGLASLGDKRRGVKMGIRAFANNGQRISRSMETVNADIGYELEQMSLQSVSINCSSASVTPTSTVENSKPEVYVIESTFKSCENQFLPNFQESLSDTLLEKLNNISFAEERVLNTVKLSKDSRGSLGMQIMEGSDGKVYVQSVILGGPAHLTGSISCGDQIVAVDGKNLLSLKYADALALLKTTGNIVEFILSQNSPSNASTLKLSELKCRANLSNLNESHLKSLRLERTMDKLKRMSLQAENIEKHLTENCYDVANTYKYNRDLPYLKYIRYETEGEPITNLNYFPKLAKSCSDISQNKAVIVDAIPKGGFDKNAVALPRSLGLSRKWKGPVKYPVTPIKKALETVNNEEFSNSDEDQIFI